MKSAFVDRYVSIMVNKSDGMIHVTGQEGLDEYEYLNTICGVKLPC